jgi:hypothetical protein
MGGIHVLISSTPYFRFEAGPWGKMYWQIEKNMVNS